MGTDTALAVEKPSVLEQTIQVDELQTRYLTAGDGLPLVLLHGAGDSAGLGRAVNPALVFQRLPGIGELAISVGRRRPGAALRALLGPFGQGQVLVRRLPVLTMPTLIVWGTADRVIPITHGRRAVRRVSRGSLVQLSRCGHAPQVECRDGFTVALSRFLQAVGQR